MRAFVLLTACASVAACNKGPEVHEKDASVAEVATKVREASGDSGFIRPGLWESKVTVEKFEMPGMPPEMSERMKTMMAQNQEHSSQNCLTPEDVKRPKEDFFVGKNNECRYDHFTMAGGKIDAAMRCGGKHGESQLMQMAGTYSPESYRMQTSMKMQGGSTPEGSMNMTMRIEANRIGECKPGQS